MEDVFVDLRFIDLWVLFVHFCGGLKGEFVYEGECTLTYYPVGQVESRLNCGILVVLDDFGIFGWTGVAGGVLFVFICGFVVGKIAIWVGIL